MKKILSSSLALLFTLSFASAGRCQQVSASGASSPTQPTALELENQFDKKVKLADHRGSVVILVYGDRNATDACRSLGEKLHVLWHPTASGQPAAQAQRAAVAPLPGTRQNQQQPNVKVIPVACCGKVPTPIRGVIRGQIATASPDVPVWLDFADSMKSAFGLTSGEPNAVIFDANGFIRMKINGTPDQAALDRLSLVVQKLRVEALK